MAFFDTHVHFERMELLGGMGAVMARAREAGVSRMVAVGGSAALDRSAEAAARAFPDAVRLALGYDRDQAAARASTPAVTADSVAALRERVQALDAAGTPLVALGEMGLDYHYASETRTVQMRLFEAQLALARELGLPVIVHSRAADEDTVALLSAHAAAWKGETDRIGVVHCYTGTAEQALRLTALGFFISFSGIVTFRNADDLRTAARMVPDNRLLIETDSPFLAPVPVRGRQNEPAHVVHVAEGLAAARGVSRATIAALTMRNGNRLFGM